MLWFYASRHAVLARLTLAFCIQTLWFRLSKPLPQANRWRFTYRNGLSSLGASRRGIVMPRRSPQGPFPSSFPSILRVWTVWAVYRTLAVLAWVGYPCRSAPTAVKELITATNVVTIHGDHFKSSENVAKWPFLGAKCQNWPEFEKAR